MRRPAACCLGGGIVLLQGRHDVATPSLANTDDALDDALYARRRTPAARRANQNTASQPAGGRQRRATRSRPASGSMDRLRGLHPLRSWCWCHPASPRARLPVAVPARSHLAAVPPPLRPCATSVAEFHCTKYAHVIEHGRGLLAGRSGRHTAPDGGAVWYCTPRPWGQGRRRGRPPPARHLRRWRGLRGHGGHPPETRARRRDATRGRGHRVHSSPFR